MPYDDKEELKTLDNARRGLDATGKPIVRTPAVPPKPPASPAIRFGKPFTEEERKKQAAAKSQALRSHFAKDTDPGYYGDEE